MTAVHEPFPLNLDYDDPDATAIPVETIIRLARRKRARHRAARAAVVAVTIAVGALVVFNGLPRPEQPGRGVTDRVLADAIGSLHRPSDPPVVVDTSHPGWQSFVYVSLDGQVCGGTASDDGPGLAISCWISLGQAAIGTWVTAPIFQALPPLDDDGRVLAIGFVRGPASTVEVTFRGHTTTTVTVAVPFNGGEGLSAYAVWLPTDGATAYGSTDVQQVTARSTTGEIVARWP